MSKKSGIKLPKGKGATVDNQNSSNSLFVQGKALFDSVTKAVAPLSAPLRLIFQVKLSANSTDENMDSNRPESIVSNDGKEGLEQKDSDKAQDTLVKEKPETCAICLDQCTDVKKLDKCGHEFCRDCIDHYFQNIKPQCPCCFTIYGEIRGNQPENGKMTHITYSRRLPGFEKTSTGTIKITYTFPDGIQDERHPNPGAPYYGTVREAYLPNNSEGQHILRLLEKAFEFRQVFTIGQSRTTGYDNVITWNDIHHKTSPTGGMQKFGYPDDTYLNRVQQELAAKGIV